MKLDYELFFNGPTPLQISPFMGALITRFHAHALRGLKFKLYYVESETFKTQRFRNPLFPLN